MPWNAFVSTRGHTTLLPVQDADNLSRSSALPVACLIFRRRWTWPAKHCPAAAARRCAGAIIFLEDYFKAREAMEVPDDIRTALLTVAETTDSRSTATGALNVLVETGEISDMEALDRLDDWKDKHHR
jgi:hypothetical protein